MALTSLRRVKVWRVIKGNRIAEEQIGHNNEVSICSELVGNELGLDEAMADDVSEEEDCICCTLVFGISEIGFDFCRRKSLFNTCNRSYLLKVATYCRH